MRKFYFVVLFLLCSAYTFASNIGHFSKSVRQDNISTEDVSGYFGQWFSVAPGTTFEVVGDNTDPMGIRHISYQQYYQGVEVEGCLVLVHARNNIVQHVNGALMETQLKPQSTVAKISKRKAVSRVKAQEDESAQYLLTPVFRGDSVEYRIAYKVYSSEKRADVYVDAETGEVLKTLSVMFDGQSAQGTALTKYSGTQSINCYYDGTEYYLYDEERGIYTFIGSKVTGIFRRSLSDQELQQTSMRKPLLQTKRKQTKHMWSISRGTY